MSIPSGGSASSDEGEAFLLEVFGAIPAADSLTILAWSISAKSGLLISTFVPIEPELKFSLFDSLEIIL